MNSASLPVQDISDTAFLTAFYRVLESDRPDAHFQDPYARILAGTRGKQVLQQMPQQEAHAPGCIVRTCVMDELIIQSIELEGVDAVLNLGAGLDTRAYRLPLPASLLWIEIDFPTVLDYKASKLAGIKPGCILKSVPLDVTNSQARQRLFRDIGSETKKVLIVTEGLLVYLNPEQVAALARDLWAQPQFSWWLTDLASHSGLQLIQNSLDQATANGEAKLQFAPAEGTNFFWQLGWETTEFRSLLEEGQRLQRLDLPEALLALLSSPEHQESLRQLFGFALLRRSESGRESFLTDSVSV
ncbi:SAM-dependent methyltransferase [Moorena sp. SIO4G3]|uniref:class I SAM-dependent methyltransferase n=1 Tax=Moorena sp. SIO4G3 TaxID=2607821 RepID=UPI00142A50BB|nr:SAM-dependent methyltransferase [Moorena sp. SIO4G3]NEO79379.1 class I SAM-dependent methyltransferase [Moorena sp. SIO4G3]